MNANVWGESKKINFYHFSIATSLVPPFNPFPLILSYSHYIIGRGISATFWLKTLTTPIQCFPFLWEEPAFALHLWRSRSCVSVGMINRIDLIDLLEMWCKRISRDGLQWQNSAHNSSNCFKRWPMTGWLFGGGWGCIGWSQWPHCSTGTYFANFKGKVDLHRTGLRMEN